MRKRIAAFLLAVVMMASVLSVFASAVPYFPSANAWKDFGQEHNYFYQVNRGSAAPRADGYITPADGYGDPITSYGFRYISTAEKAAQDKAKGEYKLKDDGEFYVYPTNDSAPEIWNSITEFEVDNPYCYLWNYYYPATSYGSSSTAYYYCDPVTHKFARTYKVVKADFTAKKYEIKNSAGNFILRDPVVLEAEPADWATSYVNYYTKVSSAYKPVPKADEAPAWKKDTYYTGSKIVVNQLYTTAEGTGGAVVPVNTLKSHRVMLPEKVNVYARYDSNYLYYAIEVVEETHKNAYYNLTNYFGTNMTNAISFFANGYDYHNYYRKDAATGELSSAIGSTIRTYSNYVSTIKSTKYILAKFGNPDATYDEVQVVGSDYNITRSKYVPPVKDTNEEDSMLGDFEDSGSADVMTSGTYGTTVYEYRLPWKVINGKYNAEVGGNAVPEMFTIRQEIELENKAGGGAFRLSLTLPRVAANLSRGRNYPTDFSVLRYPDATGLTEGSDYGTYNFRWFTSASSSFTREKSVTDYLTIDNGTAYAISHYPPVFFPSGQEPAKDYAVPSYEGAQIRADGAEEQMMRIKFSIGPTEMEVAEAGVIVAPTEVVRRQQLRLGISSVKYYAEDNPVLYGVVDGKWVNMTTLADEAGTYMSATSGQYLVTSDSYMAQDEYGGKLSGIYTVYTLPVADLDDPYDTVNTENGEKTVYSVVFGGPNGEGLYNDFDDFNTFYTIRPYVRYADGTVVYGEHEYKSLYYLACWQIQDILDEYNVTNGYDAATNRYNMDEMQLAAAKDKSGKALLDALGNAIYLPAANTSTTGSPFYGAGEYSIYHDARRAEVFRWYAVKLASRRNSNTPLRLEDYPTFDPNTKFVVDQYHQMLENIWNVIVSAEGNRYLPAKAN